MMKPHYYDSKPLSETVFTVLDVETTGLNPAHGHRICELACLRLGPDGELGQFESLVDPGRSISPGAYRVNQITATMLEGQPEFCEIADKVLDLLDGAVLVAHNAPFDLGFLSAELDIARMPHPEGPVVDTLVLARRAYYFSRNSLGAVAAALQVDPGPAHRAMGDVHTTHLILEHMLKDLELRWGITTLGGLLEFQGGFIPYPLARQIPLPPQIAEALETQGLVQMRYVDARGQETVRSVRPLRVTEQRGQLYLIAHCYHRDALRTFRLDRVAEMESQKDSDAQQ